MKTLLNLLPIEKREAIDRNRRFRYFVWQVFLLLSLELLYLGILGGTYFMLDFNKKNQQAFSEQSASGQNEDRLLKEYEKTFHEANKTAERADAVERKHYYFTRIFLLLGSLSGEHVLLDRLSTKDYLVALSGRATNRDELLAFEDRLKQESCFEKVEMPLSNLFSQENPSFQIDVTVKSDCLRFHAL